MSAHHFGRLDPAELAADKASIVDAFREARRLVLGRMTEEEQGADTERPPPPTMPAPADKPCSCCAAVHDAFEWSRLPLLGVMRDDVEAAELRNCECHSTLAVPLCIERGCNERASWVADTLQAYCGRHVDGYLLDEAAE